MTGTEEIIGQLSALSYGGIWLVSFFANVVIPIPEEITLLALGYLVGTGHINALIIIPLVISGLLASDIVLYSLSKHGSKFTTLFYERFFAKRLAQKGDRWLEMHIGKIIFISRFLVQFRFIGPFLAGQRKLPFKQFLVYDLFALVIYVPLFIFLGWYFESKISLIIEDVGKFKNILLILIGVVLTYGLLRLAYKLLFKKPGTEPEKPAQ